MQYPATSSSNTVGGSGPYAPQPNIQVPYAPDFGYGSNWASNAPTPSGNNVDGTLVDTFPAIQTALRT